MYVRERSRTFSILMNIKANEHNKKRETHKRIVRTVLILRSKITSIIIIINWKVDSNWSMLYDKFRTQEWDRN